MKILIDGRLYGLENAGLGRYLINLVGEIAGIDTENEYVILLRKKYFDSLNLPKNWKKISADFRHYGFVEQILLPGIIKKEKPDIVHFPHFNIPLLYKGDFVVTIHDMLMHEYPGLSATTLPAGLYFFKQLIYRYVFKKAILNSKKIIVPSMAVQNDIVSRFKIDRKKIMAIYEGLDDRIGFNKGQKIQTPYFVYTGNAYPHKNLKRLIEAIKKVNAGRKKKITLAIASSRNVFIERLKNVVDSLGVQKYVRLLGFVPDEELGYLYKNSSAFAFPSLSEGFGLPGLEALSAGTLLISSDIPVFREIYKDHSVYFDPVDIVSIQKAMEAVLDLGDKERAEKVAAGQNFVKTYSWNKMAKETVYVYKLAKS